MNHMTLHKTTSPMGEDNILHQSAFIALMRLRGFFLSPSPPPQSVRLFVVPKTMKHTNSPFFFNLSTFSKSLMCFIKQGVCHTMTLPFTLKSILRQKEELWKLKYFTMQKI